MAAALARVSVLAMSLFLLRLADVAGQLDRRLPAEVGRPGPHRVPQEEVLTVRPCALEANDFAQVLCLGSGPLRDPFSGLPHALETRPARGAVDKAGGPPAATAENLPAILFRNGGSASVAPAARRGGGR